MESLFTAFRYHCRFFLNRNTGKLVVPFFRPVAYRVTHKPLKPFHVVLIPSSPVQKIEHLEPSIILLGLNRYQLPKNPTIQDLVNERAFLDNQWLRFQLGETVYPFSRKRVGG